MSLDAPARASPPIGSVDDLVAWLRRGERAPGVHKVGLETEKIGVVAATGRPAPLTGPQSIDTLLRRLAVRTKGRLLEESAVAIGVQYEHASLALEPGGQLELSGAPMTSLTALQHELSLHLEEVAEEALDLGLAFVAVGYRPWGPREEVPWLPRGRYGLMRRRLPGTRAHDMMQMTASVQANFDFESEADLAEKLAAATAASPIIAALTANSPLVDGEPGPHKSERYAVWADVDAARCGLSRFMYEPGFSYRAYVEWALDAPLLFIRRQGEYRDAGGRTLRDVMREGFAGEPASIQDFTDLLSTLFPEIRVKHVVEVRGSDAVDATTTIAVAALWTALFYDPEARRAARRLLTIPFDELVELQRAIARQGLAAKTANAEVLGLARDLLRIADDGLRRRVERGETADDRGLLDPLHAIAASGRTGADRILELHRATGGRPESIVRALRY